MARQSQTPVDFNRSRRPDDRIIQTSGRAGQVQYLGYVPLLRGDSASGTISIKGTLGEMPRPLLNGVLARVQAWYVPKQAFPQFSGADEFMHSYQGETISSLGQADREPPAFFTVIDGADAVTAAGSQMLVGLGIHLPAGAPINADIIDAFWLVYNFRLAAHSSRLGRKAYAGEDIVEATKFPPAFWPTGRFSGVVPDYERALVLGALDMDVIAGKLPVSGIGVSQNPAEAAAGIDYDVYDTTGAVTFNAQYSTLNAQDSFHIESQQVDGVDIPAIFAQMAGQRMEVSLADIAMAKTTQAFAKLRTTLAGNDATGFDNDDAIVAELMQGFRVPDDQFKRPWYLDGKTVTVGMTEHKATDAANLSDSLSEGEFEADLQINIPANDSGGILIYTLEVMPERLDERATDEALLITETSQLPNALRDSQRPEPVDLVINRRLDAAHTEPGGLYGYEPMNAVWNRSMTALGGAFYQPDPLAAFTDQRAALWLTQAVDPEFTEDHYLCPVEFNHDVFSDQNAPAFEVVATHNMMIAGMTQQGNAMTENNDDYDSVKETE